MARKNANRIALISALFLLGTAGTMAQAEQGRHGHRGVHQHSATCGCEIVQYAGRITIDGCSTQITSGRGMLAQIATAFRRAGYRAWIEDGCLRVDYGRCKPVVRWQADEYAVQIRWGWDELAVSMTPIHRGGYSDRYERRRVVRPAIRVFRSGSCW